MIINIFFNKCLLFLLFFQKYRFQSNQSDLNNVATRERPVSFDPILPSGYVETTIKTTTTTSPPRRFYPDTNGEKLVEEPHRAVKFRELRLLIQGKFIARASQGDYVMMIIFNDSRKLISISEIAINSSDKAFRVEEVLSDNLNKTFQNKMFSQNLTLGMKFKNLNDPKKDFEIFNGALQLFPGEKRDLLALANNFQGLKLDHAYLSLLCEGFTGFNCQYEYEKTKDLVTDFRSGLPTCISLDNCLKSDEKCLENNCLNGGTCFVSQENDRFCVCLEGYVGTNCQHFEHDIDDEDEKFKNVDATVVKTTCNSNENKCLTGICLKYSAKTIKCHCDTNHAGKYCNLECQPSCDEESFCFVHPSDENQVPFCYPNSDKGFTNTSLYSYNDFLTYGNQNQILKMLVFLLTFVIGMFLETVGS